MKEVGKPPEAGVRVLDYVHPLHLTPEYIDEYGHLNNAQALVVLDRERNRIFRGLISVESLTEMAKKFNLGIVIAAVNVKYLREVRPENDSYIMTKLWRPRPPEFIFDQTIFTGDKPAVEATVQSFLVDPKSKRLMARPPEGIFPI